MVEMSKCPHCAGAYEPGDRYCQDCGQPLLAAAAPKKSFGWGKKRNEDGDPDEFASLFGVELPVRVVNINNIPAEVILVIAAVLYVVSAVAWANQEKIFAFFDDPKKPPVVTKVVAPAKTVVAPRVVKTSPTPVAAKPVNTIQPIAASHSDTATQTSKAESSAEPRAGQAPPLQAKPNAAVPTTVGARLASPVASASPVVPVSTTPAASAKLPPPKKAEIDSLTEYNKLLADFFAKQEKTGMSSDTEPPSYSEWLAGNKKEF